MHKPKKVCTALLNMRRIEIDINISCKKKFMLTHFIIIVLN